jgi:hypothetical protein
MRSPGNLGIFSLGMRLAGLPAMRIRHVLARVVLVSFLVSIVLALLLFACVSSAFAQGLAATQPAAIGDVVVSGSLRSRAYAWDWFGGTPDGSYAYPGSLFRVAFSESRKAYDWQLEVAMPFLLGLPEHAVVPSPQGQLGLGGTYFAANSGSSHPASAFIKQGAIRFRLGSSEAAGSSAGYGATHAQWIKVGRFEFNDGAEVMPASRKWGTALAVLERDRISQRLIGTFGFSDVGRSFDGAWYNLTNGDVNVTVLGARPSRGVYQVDGWGELNINLFYGALTRQLGGDHGAQKGGGDNGGGEWRVFALGYQDTRGSVLKTDNRPLARRRLDAGSIDLGTFGGHYLRLIDTPAGAVDMLGWMALQTGSWGALDHRAGAFAAEAGWQPPVFRSVAPWVRGGYNYGSGDGNPNDLTHGTFFQVLPTPRVYARFPFFNMMNTADGFGELMLKPTSALAIRSDIHALRLADRNDLWYAGGGAFQPGTFGYTGRPSNGQSGLATLADISGDLRVNPHVSVTGYYSYASGKLVTEAIYPTDNRAQFGYLELFIRF